MIPVCEPTLIGNEKRYALDCIETNWISSMGKYIEQFEQGFATFCGVKHAVAVNNGTTALHLALAASGIGSGDEVIVPTFTMIASVNAILYTGAKPVIVDADPETWNMDTSPSGIKKLAAKITKKTKAIMPVHIYGHPVDMDPILEIAKQHHLLVIEDAAEAHGAEYRGKQGVKKCGAMSHAACFSFYANKIITTGEGGMIVTDDDVLAERLRLLRNHAFTKKRFIHNELGYNYRMTNIQAAIGCAQLEQIEKLIALRIKNAHCYNQLFKASGLVGKGITLPSEKPWAKNVYWMYGILIDEKTFGISKDQLMTELEKQGIQTRSFFYPMHQQPMFVNKKYPNGLSDADLRDHYPVADRLAQEGLYLPSSSHLTEEQIKTVVDAVVS
ncbi:TPA: DegT/DnrJ/EryC1/StrS family aminotransferase, partial [Candidatus Woesearchaeota archaeon]|nr:DegT/DnrJ/EryC1/StrS family aminotransferase [Candidatus Woesearchaeota archaeon]